MVLLHYNCNYTLPVLLNEQNLKEKWGGREGEREGEGERERERERKGGGSIGSERPVWSSQMDKNAIYNFTSNTLFSFPLSDATLI